MLSRAIADLSPSPIGTVFRQAQDLRSRGADLIDLSIGEPAFDTPQHIRDAAHAAIEAGVTRYTASDGTPELKAAICEKFARDNGLRFDPSQIIVAAGAKPLLAAAMQVVLEPGDEVILPAPCWTSHVGMVEVCGARPVLVPCGTEAGFRLSAEALEAVISPACRILVITSPGNPSGSVYDDEALARLAVVLRRHPRVLVISDDLYEHIVFPPATFATMASVAPDLSERILTVNGLSKAFAMTGWRIGYGATPLWWADGLRTLFSHTVGCPCSVSQKAAVAALTGPRAMLAIWRDHYQTNLELALRELAACRLLSATMPSGGFFLLVNCGEALGRMAPDGTRIESSSDLSRYLLTAGVVTVPGAAFYSEPYIRVSTAPSLEVLRDGIRRIVKACDELT